MTEHDTDAEATGEDRPRKTKLSRGIRLALIVGSLALVALAVAIYSVFVVGLPAQAERIQDIIWHLESSEMTVDGETTQITVHPDTMGSVFVSNGAHLSAQNTDEDWQFASAGSWKIADEGEFTVNGGPVDARWKWNTLIIEYYEGRLLKHVEYSQGESFDISEFAPGVWQGPADAWLWWYKFEGDIITLAEDGTCQIGTLTGTWTVDKWGFVSVAAEVFSEPQQVFKVEDSNTLSLIDPETQRSLSLMSRIE